MFTKKLPNENLIKITSFKSKQNFFDNLSKIYSLLSLLNDKKTIKIFEPKTCCIKSLTVIESDTSEFFENIIFQKIMLNLIQFN